MPKHTAKRPQLSSVWWPPDEADRITHTGARLQILSEDWDDLARDWIVELVGNEAAAVIGIPDTSANPLADLSRQLSTPGMFGHEGHLDNSDPSAQLLIGQDGLLSDAGLWPKMQNVEYVTRGAGDFFVRTDVSANGKVKLRLIAPNCIWQKMDPTCPSEALERWELRLRWLQQREEWVYAWDAYDISDPDNPTFRVLEDKGEGNKRSDITNLVLPEGQQASGADYPYRFDAGKGAPFIPIVQFSSADTGAPWHWREKRGVHRGTLNTAFNWTFSQRGLRSASGRAVIAWGLAPLGSDVVRAGNGQPIQTAPIMPATMAFLKPDGTETTPNVTEVGPGANLGELLAYCEAYEMKQAVRFGLSPSDVTRQHANPTSGAALFVSNSGQRDMQRQMTPIFRPRVLELVNKTAALVNRSAGTMLVPEDGYSWRPAAIPDSPEEMEERRTDTDWQVERGFLSQVDAFRRFNPGTTDEMAMESIVKSQVGTALIDKAVAEALAAIGVATTSPPPPTPEEPAPPPAEEPE